MRQEFDAIALIVPADHDAVIPRQRGVIEIHRGRLDGACRLADEPDTAEIVEMEGLDTDATTTQVLRVFLARHCAAYTGG